MAKQNKPFVLTSCEPAYLQPENRRKLTENSEPVSKRLECCAACPRACNVNRLSSEEGVCHTGRWARVSSAFAHFGEERCLVGRRGSGTIFFAQCNLRCVFCQNADISQGRDGEAYSARELADLMLALQQRGCHNINLVTPSHVVPQIYEALSLAVEEGLKLPIVYNTSGYDALETIRALDGVVDIYMPDFKLWSAAVCGRYLGTEDYGHAARKAIREMHRQVGDLKCTPEGIACRGLMIRHLVMPGLLEESNSIFHWLAGEISADTLINIMGQYRPANRVCRESAPAEITFHEINRSCTAEEMHTAHKMAREAGLWRFDR
jgi:putative pyruvate formate lyase activating enzyme